MKKRVEISLIKDNPRSKALFPKLPADEFEALKEDIRERGIQVPVEVDADFTILCGHERVKACRELGISELEVIVREDLKEEEEKETHMINDNILRRHMDLEQRVGLVRYLLEKYGRATGRPKKDAKLPPFLEGKGKTREKVGKVLGMSKRTVDTYVKIGKLPEEEQEKVYKGEKKIKDALGEETSLPLVPEEAEEGPEREPALEGDLVRGFDPAREIESGSEARCVRCGRTAYGFESDAEKCWFVAMLIKDFVKGDTGELCSDCLSGLYKKIGGYVRRQWENFLRRGK